jgi:hypothetical protein
MVQPRQRRPRVATIQKAGLDAAAYAYARLLADPCNGKLVRGIAVGSSGALVVRLESDSIIFNDATSTGGYLTWFPSQNAAFVANAAVDTTLTTGLFAGFICPGYNYFQATASSMRCIAACAQVMFPGTELNRSGVVGMGIVPCSALSKVVPIANGGAAATTTTANVRQLCQLTERMPDTMAEIIWRPGQADGEMTDLTSLSQSPGAIVGTASGKNSVVISIAGLPVATGVRVRTVGIYEYEPLLAQGFIATVESTNSSNTLNDVLRVLDGNDPHWFTNSFKRAGRNLVSAGIAGVTQQMVSLMNPGGVRSQRITY